MELGNKLLTNGLPPETDVSHAEMPAEPLTLAERMESLKAGLLGAIATSLVWLGWLALEAGLVLEPLPTPWLEAGFSGFVVVLSGFLFGITYRYVIRTTPNPHLKSGAVLAFGLVRGLAQVDAAWPSQTAWLSLVAMLGESMVMFAVARTWLDRAIVLGWVKAYRE